MSYSLIYPFVILVSILVIGIMLVASRYMREIRTARERLNSLNSRVIDTTCGPIEYLRMGEGYPVLVVHGALGGFDQGLWLAQRMGHNISNLQVISVSRFGHLRSPVPAGANLDAQADAFARLLDALEIRQAAVFAASGGSTPAIRFAARHPERVSALILLCPDAPPGMPLPPRFVFDTFSATSPYPLSKIETPVLVIHALDDPITIPENVRGLAERMPNARLFVVPDGGHFFFGHNEEVKEEIARFLRSSVAELHSETLIHAGGLSNVHAN